VVALGVGAGSDVGGAVGDSVVTGAVEGAGAVSVGADVSVGVAVVLTVGVGGASASAGDSGVTSPPHKATVAVTV